MFIRIITAVILTLILTIPFHFAKAEVLGREFDRSCVVNADCAIVDVRNCCGYYPMCLNAEVQVDKEAFDKHCAENEITSVCGFPSLDSCQCVEGQCTGSFSGHGGAQ